MGEPERVRQVVALNRVNAGGDAQTREFIDVLLEDRPTTLEDSGSLFAPAQLARWAS